MLALGTNAATWTCYPEITNGMTGPEQITNALTQLASGDTILVKPGTYDFTGISMRTDNYTKDGVTYVITNHLYRNIAFTLKGDTSGHWDDAVIFTGNGRCCDLKSTWKYCYFNNITFDGFDCNRYPCSGSFESRGGALRLEDNSLVNTVSNCVFRNCSAYIGGAVNGGTLVDCLCTNNYASSNGGGGSNTRFERCRVVFNRAGGSHGGSYSHFGCFDSYFEGNTGVDGGALRQGGYVCSNCTFVANVARSGGGAIYADNAAPGEILDCTFIENVATNAGGAIHTSTMGRPNIRGCTFVSNSVANLTSTATYYGGGAIYSPLSSEANTISNCTFFGNWTERNYGGAAVNGVYEDCTFISNRVKAIAYGGACYFVNSTGAVRRCVFFDNMVVTNGIGGAVCASTSVPVVDSAFTNNYAWTYGGAVHKGFCTNCTFTGNMTVTRGGALSEGEAFNCVFRDNRKYDRVNGTKSTHYEYGGGSAYLSRLIRCDFTDGAFWKCSLADCSIHDVENSIAPCVFDEEHGATNCLVSGGSGFMYGLFYRYLYRPGGASDYRGAIRGSMVNCTFADNTVATDGIFGFNGVHKTNDFDFVNCIFSVNMVVYRGGALSEGEAVDCVFRGNRKGDRFGRTTAHDEFG
ncbi:MAG: hypothetical protein J6V72_09015, partial [Kiritimatiellae bacterium]|nr:hypothetical protein [Kiritimatiellia bacterium]